MHAIIHASVELISIERFFIMMLVGILGGLVACGSILAAVRSAMRAKKSNNLQTVKFR